MFVDGLDGQTTPEFMKFCKDKCNVLVWVYPGGLTDMLQPVDAGYGRDVKREMGRLMLEWLDNDDNLEKWENGELSAADRRVLMTHWAAVAVANVNKDVTRRRRYFEKTGNLMTADRSGDDKIQPQGTTKYTFALSAEEEEKEAREQGHAPVLGDTVDEEHDPDFDPDEVEEELPAVLDESVVGDDEPDEKERMCTFEEAMPDGFAAKRVQSKADLKKREKIMFRWTDCGWQCGTIRQVFCSEIHEENSGNHL